MRKLELSDNVFTSIYSVYVKEELYKDSLTYEEMGDTLLELAQEFYETGEPDPQTIEVKVTGAENGKASLTD